MKKKFPKEGWDTHWIRCDRHEIHFDMTRCIYKDICDAEGCPELCRVFCENETVFDFSSMLLPRFLADLSPEIAEHYHHLLFNPSTSRLFNEEMLRTIEVFFQKDLNLSDTARQLYIHRNTLVYRLDKVQRETGLDLRKFADAVTFKMLLDMRKCQSGTDKTPD